MAMHGLPQGITQPPRSLEATAREVGGEAREPSHWTPGTVVLVAVFLAAFVLYYFVNWKLLSLVWKVG